METSVQTINEAVTMRLGGGDALGRIDQYEIVRELGGGGFGTVYLAKDTVSGVEVAVKGLPPFVRNNREELENIRANFALVARLTHTNIAKALVLHPAKNVGYVSEGVREKLRVMPGDTLMVMEYAPGVTLSQWRKQFPERKVPMEQALEIVRQVASALDYAHGQKIIHRDIKPANVMVETRPDGGLTVRVLDFGLAAEIRSSMGRVSQEIHDTSGTRPYMAPEQWLAEKQGTATDQYALAVMFNELVTGEVPFASVFETGDPVMMMNIVGNKPFVADRGLPKSVRLSLEKALAKKPTERFANCVEFVGALEGKVKIARTGTATQRNGGGAVKVFGILALLVALGVGGWWYYAQRQETARRELAQLVAAQEEEAERKAAAEAEQKAAEAAERKAKEKAARLAAEKAETERRAQIEAEQKAETAARAGAMEIRIEAVVQKGKVDRVSDEDGFKVRKVALADLFVRAEALCDEKVRRWSEAAQQFTNYVSESRSLLTIDGERRSAAAKRDEAEAARERARETCAEKYATRHWDEALRLWQTAVGDFERMKFVSAEEVFGTVARLFTQCAEEAVAERKRQAEVAEAKAKADREERERKEAENLKNAKEKAQPKSPPPPNPPAPKPNLSAAAQKLLGKWVCDMVVTEGRDLVSKSTDAFLRGKLPVSSRLTLQCDEDGTVAMRDASGRTVGNSTGTWRYRHGLLCMQLATANGRKYQLSGYVNWRGSDGFELRFDNTEYANMIKLGCSDVAALQFVTSMYTEGNLEVMILSQEGSVISAKSAKVLCAPFIFKRQ